MFGFERQTLGEPLLEARLQIKFHQAQSVHGPICDALGKSKAVTAKGFIGEHFIEDAEPLTGYGIHSVPAIKQGFGLTQANQPRQKPTGAIITRQPDVPEGRGNKCIAGPKSQVAR